MVVGGQRYLVSRALLGDPLRPLEGWRTRPITSEMSISNAEQHDIKVQPDKKPDIPKAEWPYSITVFACLDGVKAQKLATLDPRIIWQD